MKEGVLVVAFYLIKCQEIIINQAKHMYEIRVSVSKYHFQHFLILFWVHPTYRMVAIQFMAKFPKTLEDRDDLENHLGNGYTGIENKIKNRINYLNRPYKRGRTLQDVLHRRPKNKKLMQSLTAGTIA